MKAINLYSFTRIEPDYASEYMNMLSERSQRDRCRSHEFLTVKSLVEHLLEQKTALSLLDGFFFSYSIHQIGKEFDLLKIEKDRAVLNIELKSEQVDPEDIEKQLRQNRYYLSFIAADVRSFTFVASTGELYQLTGDVCRPASWDALMEALSIFSSYMTSGIEKLFEPKQFLISPFTDPGKFLLGKYFLTQQQQEIRERIISAVEDGMNDRQLYGITGGTGSGKTLLLYDIARTLARKTGSCCVLHNGELSEGHRYLNQHWEHVHLYSMQDLQAAVLREYDFIFVDEAHQMLPEQLEELLSETEQADCVLVFSYDDEQWLSRRELEWNIPSVLTGLDGFTEWTLSRRIRTGIEIAAFYRNMLCLGNVPRGEMDYSHIDILYAADETEAEALLQFYDRQLKYFCPGRPSSDSSIGQEYDNVLISVSGSMYYDEEGYLRDRCCPEDMDLENRLYRHVTRTRGRLCILVTGSYELFQQIAGIKYRMLERVRYKEKLLPGAFSGKQLTRLSKALKEAAGELPMMEQNIVLDTVDILQEQLMRTDAGRKILRNSLHVLEHFKNQYSDCKVFALAVEDYVSCIESELSAASEINQVQKR